MLGATITVPTPVRRSNSKWKHLVRYSRLPNTARSNNQDHARLPIPLSTRKTSRRPALSPSRFHLSPSSNLRTCSRGSWSSQAAGVLLARMLYHAGFPIANVKKQINFFQAHIACRLGQQRRRQPYIHRMQQGGPDLPAPTAEGWKSFMTDDGTPIELSWAWEPGKSLPRVRYSIEPVGAASGSPQDPHNALAPSMFAQHLRRLRMAGPRDGLDWRPYDRLHELFVTKEPLSKLVQSATTKSQMFFAFDLEGVQHRPKAYFLPHTKAAQLHCTEWDLVARGLKILDVPRRQVAEMENYLLTDMAGLRKHSVEMLAIDILPAQKPWRVKVYSRIWTTDFEKVWDALMLGGRFVEESETKRRAKENLRTVWVSILGLEDERRVGYLHEAGGDHRTSGTLLYHGFRHGRPVMEPKVYIPVRHYAISDLQVAQAVQSALQRQGQCLRAGLGYVEGLQSLWHVMVDALQ